MANREKAQDILRSVGDYPMLQQDTVDKFHGKQLNQLS